MERKITGFAFIIREGVEKRQVRLFGSGGLLGNGCLHTEDWTPAKVKKVKNRCLMCAKVELDQYGCVREWLGDDLPPSQRIAKIIPDAIEACRVLREGTC